MKEKPECKGCLYSIYDYDGRNPIFLCCDRSKCTGHVEPKKEEHFYTIDGEEVSIYQTQWNGYQGVTVNLVVFIKKDGAYHEVMHSGFCGRFLSEEERIALAKSILEARKGESRRIGP